MTVKARFKWADGYVDYRNVPNAPLCNRYRFDREDQVFDLPSGFWDSSDSLRDATVDVVVFERKSYSDGSFEFVEKK